MHQNLALILPQESSFFESRTGWVNARFARFWGGKMRSVDIPKLLVSIYFLDAPFPKKLSFSIRPSTSSLSLPRKVNDTM